MLAPGRTRHQARPADASAAHVHLVFHVGPVRQLLWLLLQASAATAIAAIAYAAAATAFSAARLPLPASTLPASTLVTASLDAAAATAIASAPPRPATSARSRA